jgi:cation diffusion facilitator CzcD-associated flavoprotein CzcO
MTDEGYSGPARLDPGGGEIAVRVRLSGRVEPVDGRFHWAGRLTGEVPSGVRSGRLRIGDEPPQRVRLGDVDPWGGVRVSGEGPAPWPSAGSDTGSEPEHVDIAIIGAGFSGIGAAIRLKQEGFADFAVFEQADEVGGTWRDNTYPGCACDVPSHLYSFSFASNPDWSDTFSGQAEIWAYLRRCVDRFGIRPHLRLGHSVAEAAWDDGAGHWRLETSGGSFTARVLVGATGPLSAPSTPDIPGLESFEGTVFHSARWNHEHDLTGRRVAAIGTGASAIQFVPAIAPTVEHLTLFQRTPAWVIPRRSRTITRPERAIYRHVPGAQRLVRAALYWARDAMAVGFLHPRVNRAVQRVALLHLRSQVPDPALRERLTPRYTFGCKRVLISNDYYPALTRDNVELVTERIREVRADRIVAADGTEHPVDTIILGTGFHVTDSPLMRLIRGRDGKPLESAWTPSMRAHLGTAVAGFPNLFLLLGPNTGLGHTSVVLMAESQIEQVIRVLRYMRRNRLRAVEPTVDAQRRYTERVDAKMARTVWLSGCSSWYLDATGRNSTLWPGYATGFRRRLRRLRADDYAAVA